MPSKNDLSGLKKATSKPVILPTTDKPTTTGKRSKGQGIGRPPKAEEEKRSYKVTLSLTPSEGARLAEKSGLAGEATFLYAKLKEMGII